MVYLAYGAEGTLAVLGLLALGFFSGWKANNAFVKYSRKRAAAEATEEQRRQLAAQQQAFEEMLNYNQDIAYGMNNNLTALGGGEQ